MASNGVKYIKLPLYLVNIGLLFALLLTSALVLAWVTIYSHEQSIVELRKMLNNRQQTHPSQAADTEARTAGEPEMLVQEGLHDKEINDDGPRVRRGKEKKDNKCSVKCAGEKGERGPRGKRGKRGDRGSKGEDGDNGSPGLPGHPGHPGSPGHRGDRGPPGYPGAKGDMGVKGVAGKDGNQGEIGEKGDKGESGSSGFKGSKGDRGNAGQLLMRLESAHIVGTGKMIPSQPSPGSVYLITSWKPQHLSGNMTYDDNGHLIVKVSGVYVVYGQMFYNDRNNTYTGFSVYIDSTKVLRAIYSIVDFYKPYHTQYMSGVFKIKKGQKIWVGTSIKRKYFYNESSAFFGAFMLHP